MRAAIIGSKDASTPGRSFTQLAEPPGKRAAEHSDAVAICFVLLRLLCLC